jgi:nicotinamidase-related amidase
MARLVDISRCDAEHPPEEDRMDEPALPESTALVVVDAQRGFDDPSWGPRNNPDCDRNIAALVDAWAEVGWPLVYVRHASDEIDSPLRPDHPGHAFKPYLDEHTPDVLVTKSVNSSFHGEPDLAAWLRGQEIGSIVVAGITTNHCVETTVRVGGNLGFDVWLALDATHTFDRMGPDGTTMTADELTRATATSVHEEFATVVGTAQVLDALRQPRHPKRGS